MNESERCETPAGTHMSEDPARKRLMLSEEAETMPAESEHSGATGYGGTSTLVHPVHHFSKL